MITIKMHEGKWRIEIENEVWGFDRFPDIIITLEKLMAMKNVIWENKMTNKTQFVKEELKEIEHLK